MHARGSGVPRHEVYVQNQQNQVRRVERFLEKTGIYDVVGEQDVRTVLGDQRVERRQLEQNGWMLARQIGKALHANYVMVMERVKQRGAVGESDFLFVNVMINVGTGAVFESRSQLEGMTRGDREEQRELIRSTYWNIFLSCKKDMLAIAVRKGRSGLPPALRETAAAPAPVKPEPSGSQKETRPPVSATEQMPSPNLPGLGLLEVPMKSGGAKKLVVYDRDASDQYRTVALILGEALREEVFKLKHFVLVNREDLQKVLEEMALQQTA